MPRFPHPLPRLHSRTAPARDAFTLIELLTVIAIIGILAAILIPTVGAVRQSARAATCVSNLRQISSAALIFANDNKGRFPGKGQQPSSFSACWQEVLNTFVFRADINSVRPPIQRLGDTPLNGMLYCPTMQPFGTAPRFPRAYLMNGFTINQNPATNPTTNLPPLISYQKGEPVGKFLNPSRTILFFESERDTDRSGNAIPINQIVMGDGVSAADYSANSGYFAFGHKNRMNIAFIDGHVTAVSPQVAATMNNNGSFSPTGI